jgi:hypothetical protein
MKLNEWKDSNGNKVGTTTSPVTKAPGTQSFKERFLKLLTYHIIHKRKTVVSYKVKTLTDDSFLYIEEHKNPATGEEWEVDYSVYIGGLTEVWRLKVSKNKKYTDNLNGTGWVNLLRELRPYMSIPVVGTPEYNKLLKETSIAEEFEEYENLWD